MTAEKIENLIKNVVRGFRGTLGLTWQSSFANTDELRALVEANHYDGPVPIERVRDMFNFEVVPQNVYIPKHELVVPDEDVLRTLDKADLIGLLMGTRDAFHKVPNAQAITPSDDPTHVFKIFSESYRAHQYDQWLIKNVEALVGTPLGDGQEFGISSAGLLANRGVAWVEVGAPVVHKTPEGIDFATNLLATTSLNGKSSTIYKRTVTYVVCDNTRAAALAENGAQYKRRHTAHSDGALSLAEAREQLGLLTDVELELRAMITAETQRLVTLDQFDQIVAELYPVKAEAKRTSRRDNIVEATRAFYLNDPRVTDYNGTAFGVAHALDTFHQHVSTVRGKDRLERNRLEITGDTAFNREAKVQAAIDKVLASA